LNEWLRQKGYLELDQDIAQYTGLRRTFAHIGLTRRNVSSLLRKYKLAWFENWLADHLGDRVYLLPRTQRTEFPVGIDWSRTRAYSFGYQGQIYINLKGREGNGIVNPGEEYEQLLEQIKAELLLLVDPKDGKPVVDQVFRKEQLFNGPYIGLAPDLTLMMRDMAYMTRYGYEQSPEAGRIFTDPMTNESGSHRRMGILIACGPDIKPDSNPIIGAKIIDLAPTILHLLGCPIPSTMDGQLLRDYFMLEGPPSFIAEFPLTQDAETNAETLSEEEHDEMINRLKNMGYLE
jgi:predicted AlkP superfamily phosphohydrolase/phosphomutase